MMGLVGSSFLLVAKEMPSSICTNRYSIAVGGFLLQLFFRDLAVRVMEMSE
jgi:hypothetical protein